MDKLRCAVCGSLLEVKHDMEDWSIDCMGCGTAVGGSEKSPALMGLLVADRSSVFYLRPVDN